MGSGSSAPEAKARARCPPGRRTHSHGRDERIPTPAIRALEHVHHTARRRRTRAGSAERNAGPPRHDGVVPRTDTAFREIAAPPGRVFAALVDPDALAAWLPPGGMSARFERFDARPGGSYRMVLT